MTRPATADHRTPLVPGVLDEHQPAQGSAAGWPLVLYFHHVHPDVRHYTALTPTSFAAGLEAVLARFTPLDPRSFGREAVPRPEEPSVLITFDDGYRDNHDIARAILRDVGVRAVFFACTGLLGQRSAHAREDYMSLTECDALVDDGHVVAAHTRTHPHLDRIDPGRVQDEALGSIEDIARRYGPAAARLFAYPYGGIPERIDLPDGTLAFGSVRSPATPWTDHPQSIRRTYLPSGHQLLWPDLIDRWHRDWKLDDGAEGSR
ncbi:polysaccharide deacetylase family protein [Aeromicrobium fastidiosum]|uniref:polysaccharide deacetylase family protein n=1 Tax=Aeromicrobium fastidiosum TaxID=52699 RepID=UPI00165FB499|nr:polysaccharide deacetylase family protein [Aeromicrobium fastidiosum]MBP2390301.1 peptidoglycan/xylan/chitin deacetylase (PgdA/CDA1 family) [Aeromicrobium fastidiosum]